MVLSSDPILIVACGGAGARSLPRFDVFFFAVSLRSATEGLEALTIFFSYFYFQHLVVNLPIDLLQRCLLKKKKKKEQRGRTS